MKSVALLISLSVVLTVCDAYSKTQVSVTNIVVGNPITIHCFSGDDDLGYHTLAYQEPFSWSFRYSLIADTKFFCTITTQFGSGNYMVYGNDIMLNRCGLNCQWQVQNAGPCLLQTKGDYWCLQWDKHA